MRCAVAVIAIIGLSASAMAQSPPSAASGSPTLPSIGLPLPPIGLPLPPIGLPLPPIGLPPVSDTRPQVFDDHVSRDAENRPSQSGSSEFRSAPSLIFFVPAYGWGYPYPGQIASPPSSSPDTSPNDRKPERLTGNLRLDMKPDGAVQVFVDGYYVGTRDDFNGELELDAGTHTIEIRAHGYETLTFDVKITPGRSITYRGELKSADDKPEPDGTRASVTPAGPTTFYYIPGCYLGNVPPKDVKLPATCDVSRLITRKP